MKITYIETHINGQQRLGSDFTSVCRNLDTPRKLNNAIQRHVKKLQTLTSIHPDLKSNYQIKYTSIYR